VLAACPGSESLLGTAWRVVPHRPRADRARRHGGLGARARWPDFTALLDAEHPRGVASGAPPGAVQGDGRAWCV